MAAGGDIAISPDNLDAGSQYLMINEDGTTESRAVMAAHGQFDSLSRDRAILMADSVNLFMRQKSPVTTS